MGGIRYLISKSKQTNLNYYLFIARVLVWLLFINFVGRLQRVCACVWVCVLIEQINIQAVCTWPSHHRSKFASAFPITIKSNNVNSILLCSLIQRRYIAFDGDSFASIEMPWEACVCRASWYQWPQRQMNITISRPPHNAHSPTQRNISVSTNFGFGKITISAAAPFPAWTWLQNMVTLPPI